MEIARAQVEETAEGGEVSVTLSNGTRETRSVWLAASDGSLFGTVFIPPGSRQTGFSVSRVDVSIAVLPPDVTDRERGNYDNATDVTDPVFGGAGNGGGLNRKVVAGLVAAGAAYYVLR